MRELFVCALLGLLAGAPAAAIESVSGSYEGKLICKGVATGDFVKDKSDVEIGIMDDGAGNLLLVISGVGTFEGFVLGSMRKPETGTLSGVSCTLGIVDLEGAAFHAEVKVKAGSPKASFKATLTRMDLAGSSSALCTLKAKRVSTIPPKLTNCPL
jgi:hypothetical protein